jgi:hypothetical protein
MSWLLPILASFPLVKSRIPSLRYILDLNIRNEEINLQENNKFKWAVFDSLRRGSMLQ